MRVPFPYRVTLDMLNSCTNSVKRFPLPPKPKTVPKYLDPSDKMGQVFGTVLEGKTPFYS